MKYFEIYISGKDGFSTYVKTEKPSGEAELLGLAITAKVIDSDDAQNVYQGTLKSVLSKKCWMP